MSEAMDRATLERTIEDARRIWHLGTTGHVTVKLLADAAAAHLETLPKTKMVEVWRVEFAERQEGGGEWRPLSHTFTLKEQADEYKASLTSLRPSLRCIRVTGPHQQMVPA